MKFSLKMIAVAAAMVSAAGAAHADLTPASSGNGSIALVAFNTSTRDYYIRDLGFLLNSFLPSSVTTLSGDGGVTGNRTPAEGLLLNSSNTPSFADASFSTWLGSQNQADIRWMVAGADSAGTTTTTNVKRGLVSSANDAETVTNSQLDNFVGTANAGGLSVLFGTGGLSITGSGAPASWDQNFLLGADGLASLNQSVSLFYFARSTGTGSTSASSNLVRFGNATGFASVTLESDGDFVYSLAGAPVSTVPVPAAAWLLGSGLLGLGGMVRRRKAAAQA